MPRKPKNEAPLLGRGTRSRPYTAPKPVKAERPASKIVRRKKPTVTKKRSSKPTYYKMICQAIEDDGAHISKGTSRQAIVKYILSRYPIANEAFFKRYIRVALKKSTEQGLLTRPRLHSYALPKKTQKSSTSNRKTTVKKSVERKILKTKVARPQKSSRVDNSTDDSLPIVEEGVPTIWFWQYYHNGWRNYYPEPSRLVEETYQLYLKEAQTGRIIDVRAVKSGDWSYMIDFRQMTQTNIEHYSNTVRKIRRVQIPASSLDRSSFGYVPGS